MSNTRNKHDCLTTVDLYKRLALDTCASDRVLIQESKSEGLHELVYSNEPRSVDNEACQKAIKQAFVEMERCFTLRR